MNDVELWKIIASSWQMREESIEEELRESQSIFG